MTKKLQDLISNGIVCLMALFAFFALLFNTVALADVPSAYADAFKITGFEAITFDTFLADIDKAGVEIILGIASILVLIASIGAIALAAFAFYKALKNDADAGKFFNWAILASLAITAFFAVVSIICTIVVNADYDDFYTVAYIPLIIEAVLFAGYKFLPKLLPVKD